MVKVVREATVDIVTADAQPASRDPDVYVEFIQQEGDEERYLLVSVIPLTSGRESHLPMRKSEMHARKSLFLIRKSQIPTRKWLFPTRKSEMHARKSLFLIRKSQIPTRPLIIPAVEQATRRWTISDQSLQRISGSRITERADPNETPASQGVDFKSYRWPSVTSSFARGAPRKHISAQAA